MQASPQPSSRRRPGSTSATARPRTSGSRPSPGRRVEITSIATGAIREAIRARALAMGFDAVGFAAARLAERARADLREYLDRGYHGDMGWLADTAARRGDPQTLWHEA